MEFNSWRSGLGSALLLLALCVSGCGRGETEPRPPHANAETSASVAAPASAVLATVEQPSAASPPSSAPAGPRPIKIGLLAPFSGFFAGVGAQMQGGVQAYLDQHGRSAAGHPIEVLARDTMGVEPDLAKRLASELIFKDQVDFLAGFALTPTALAVAPLATEARKPMVIMNAATSSLTTKSPYIVRFGFTLPQVTAPLATWAAKNGIESAYMLVSDLAAGLEAATQFQKSFQAAGGKIVGSARTPLQNPDFMPFAKSIKEANPQAVFVFVPTGMQDISLMKAFKESGLLAAGVKVIATGDVTDDRQLPQIGDTALGIVTTHHYSVAHESPENDAFKAAFAKVTSGDFRPNFVAVAAYDGMAGIARVIETLHGEIDGDRAMEVFKGMRMNSPRGPIYIDPQTRDIVQTVYVRKVERRADGPYNIEFDKVLEQSDPGK